MVPNGSLKKTKIIPKVAIVPDGLTHNHIILKQKGPLHLILESKGTSSHASIPWKGKNPIDTLLLSKKRIENSFSQATNNSEWKPTFTVTNIKALSSINQVPDKAQMTLDVRLTKASQLKLLKAIIQKSGLTIKNQFGDGQIFRQTKTLPVMKWQETVKCITGKTPKFTSSSGGSDARHLPKATNAIITQVRGGNAHAKNEWVDTNSLLIFSDILRKFLETV